MEKQAWKSQFFLAEKLNLNQTGWIPSMNSKFSKLYSRIYFSIGVWTFSFQDVAPPTFWCLTIFAVPAVKKKNIPMTWCCHNVSSCGLRVMHSVLLYSILVSWPDHLLLQVSCVFYMACGKLQMGPVDIFQQWQFLPLFFSCGFVAYMNNSWNEWKLYSLPPELWISAPHSPLISVLLVSWDFVLKFLPDLNFLVTSSLTCLLCFLVFIMLFFLWCYSQKGWIILRLNYKQVDQVTG